MKSYRERLEDALLRIEHEAREITKVDYEFAYPALNKAVSDLDKVREEISVERAKRTA